MAEKVNPSPGRLIESFPTAGAIAYGGHGDDGFVRDGNNPTRIAIQEPNINEANLNTFDASHSTSSLDVTIDPGEAFVFGAWVCIDESTTVSLDPSTSNQTVLVGWDTDASDNVVIGLESAFTTTGLNADRTIELFDFDTDGSGVTNVTDKRRTHQIPANSINQGSGSGLDADTVDGVEAVDLGSSISDDGTQVAATASDINFGAGLSVTDDGDGTVTVDGGVPSHGSTHEDGGSDEISNLADLTVQSQKISFPGNTLVIGSDATNPSEYDQSVIMGQNAGAFSSGTPEESTIIGPRAEQLTSADGVVSVGYEAGFFTGSGDFRTAIGYQANKNGSFAPKSVSLGYQSGMGLRGDSPIAIGDNAGLDADADYSIYIGRKAGENVDAQENIIALGGNDNGGALTDCVTEETFAVGTDNNDVYMVLDMNSGDLYIRGQLFENELVGPPTYRP